jgi:hypothetical protein
MTHAELVQRAARWLAKTKRCAVVATEIATSSATGESPDAIGWWGGWSHLVECKASRSDFLADKRKPFRIDPAQGLGDYRWYMAPPGLISPEELPAGWGLLEVHANQVRMVRKSCHPGCEGAPPFEGNNREERRILLSIIRRGRGDYTLPTKRTTIAVDESADAAA